MRPVPSPFFSHLCQPCTHTHTHTPMHIDLRLPRRRGDAPSLQRPPPRRAQRIRLRRGHCRIGLCRLHTHHRAVCQGPCTHVGTYLCAGRLSAAITIPSPPPHTHSPPPPLSPHHTYTHTPTSTHILTPIAPDSTNPIPSPLLLKHTQVSGYSHKLPVLLDRVARRITGYLQELKAKGDSDPEVRKRIGKGGGVLWFCRREGTREKDGKRGRLGSASYHGYMVASGEFPLLPSPPHKTPSL